MIHWANRRYVLIGQTAVPEPDHFQWLRFMEDADLRVAFDVVGPFEISTLFLGVDYGWHDGGALKLFETAVFLVTGDGDERQIASLHRTATWAEAEAEHARAVASARFAAKAAQ